MLVITYTTKNISGWADLNRRPLGPEPSALATAPQPVSLIAGYGPDKGDEPCGSVIPCQIKKTPFQGVIGSDGV